MRWLGATDDVEHRRQDGCAAQPRPLILVVDDDAPIVAMLNDLLDEEGYRCIGCLRVQDAAEALQREVPALIIADLRVGTRTADWDFLSRLKGDSQTATIPSILWSADSTFFQDNAEVLAALGVVGLAKPFPLDDLLAHVTRLIGVPTREQVAGQ